MKQKLLRVGTAYIPVTNVSNSLKWYTDKLGAVESYKDEKGKMAIINMASQSFFLVESPEQESMNFFDSEGNKRFSLTFEVDGLAQLKGLHEELLLQNVKIGEIENRGHPGRNFVFSDPDGNLFDVWSELSPSFKKRI
ncbi:VOC family protein [Bacillus sp. ISL-47]|uniref:VOC family protein n=1 Tax=Bacillus sp. ISL-47 TaxID=2819130 RepID=UPI001BE8E129|nr:VOC family protein [Bacillus sp. ISL-47]MBT2689309.1 VOC family protein [Bacillus sp. ISL-47]MBT2707200.1 VOC family protein [Pseudomonas sp. ISL-84]